MLALPILLHSDYHGLWHGEMPRLTASVRADGEILK